MSENSCEFCKYWANDGTCRRYAPRPMTQVDGGQVLDAFWPRTAFSDYCAEFIHEDSYE